jgi:hypothetical protein
MKKMSVFAALATVRSKQSILMLDLVALYPFAGIVIVLTPSLPARGEYARNLLISGS